VPDYEVNQWLSTRGLARWDYEDVIDAIQIMDPTGRCAMASSDRVYDIQFEEWGVDGMPSRYLSIRNERALIRLLREHNDMNSG
jgi:hypothetical protein